MSKTPSLAKLTPPRLTKVYNRTRLFKQLDEAREKPVIWISAPAGSGKTTLVASYLKERKIKPRWYQVDEGDADIASFFYYLGLLGKQAAPRKKKDLPLLTPEYLLGLPTFTRNFFRELFSRMKTPGVLVLDNFQDAGEEISLHEILPAGLQEIPEGISVIIISRSEPVASVARLRTSENLIVFGWDQLRLTDDESVEVGKLRTGAKSLDDAAYHSLNTQTDGWVTGLVLQLEHTGTIAVPDSIKHQANQKLVFDYFAGEIFNNLDKESQEFLLRIAFLPKISIAAANQLAPGSKAEKILSNLTERNYFTIRHEGKTPGYEFHPLFREFLQARTQKKLAADQVSALFTKSAQVLAGEGDIEAAAELYIKGASWDALAALILNHAQQLVAQGRHGTLREWLTCIPDEQMESNPWLLFWLGAATQAIDLFAAREYFARAYRIFRTTGDVAGIYFAWSAAVDTFMYFWANFSPLSHWIEEMHSIRKEYPDYPSAMLEARVVGGMISALMWRNMRYQVMQPWVERAEALLLNENIDVGQRVIIANNLIVYYVSFRGEYSSAMRLLSIVRPLIQFVNNEPLPRLLWAVMESHSFAVFNQADDCLRVVENGLKLADESGVHFLDTLLNAQGVYGTLFAADLNGAQYYLKRSHQCLLPNAFLDIAHYHQQATWAAICSGDFFAAHEHIDAASDFAERSGAVNAPIWVRHTLAHIQAEMGEYGAALISLDESLQWAEMAHNYAVMFHCLLTKAHVLFKMEKNDTALAVLRDALRLGKRQGYIAHPWIGWRRDLMAQLFAVALHNNLEADYVRSVIQQRRLTPPPNQPTPPNWPFPIKVTTLGALKLVIDDEPVVFKGKAQRKPIELLKALIAYGGKDINAQHLAESLWPDAEGDAAYQSLTMTLKRLRQLVGKKEALVLIEGKLTLDPQYAWVDVWALAQGSQQDDPKQLQQALGLYQGAFLEGDDGSWAISPREQWRSKSINIVSKLGEAYEKEQQWQAAITVYQQGLQIDPIAERFYQGMMRCYAELGERAEALKSYETCQDKLQNQLGVAPSVATVELYNKLCEG